jgi:Fe-S cluster assembly protein SufB
MNNSLKKIIDSDYKAGFISNVKNDTLKPGINEDIIKIISRKKNEPEFILEWRLKAFKHWKQMKYPKWSNLKYNDIDFQSIIYYSVPDNKKINSLDDVDPEILDAYNKLGIPLHEQKTLSNVAVDVIFDSTSIFTTFKDKLAEKGVIFCSISEAIKLYPDLIKKYLGSVVSYKDNFYASLNAAVFSDGSFVYIPKNTICPMELSSYFRINANNIGQFERTLIIVEDNSYVSYLEGCTAPIRDNNQLHAAVVEIVAANYARVKYSTVQNWYPGNNEGVGGIFNFVTKRGLCKGYKSHISWTQIETGSAITWKYPSVILQGDYSKGEFYSVALTSKHQQADTGTKMIHIGNNSSSTIISKGISAAHGTNTYRGLVRVLPMCENARNYTQCDSLLLGEFSSAHTFPSLEIKNNNCNIEHEASTSKISEEQLFFLRQRGLNIENAVSLIVIGFCKNIFHHLPLEFAVEVQQLMNLSLEGIGIG